MSPPRLSALLDGSPGPDLAGGRPPDQLLDAPAEDLLPCWTQDPDLWFAESPADVETAKALCVPCPLREACLSGALERAEPWGVWGGQLLLGGVVVPRKRPRGRPRKDAPPYVVGVPSPAVPLDDRTSAA